jgi:hypothetical protein
MARPIPLDPLYIITPGSWLSRQMRTQLVTALGLKRRGRAVARLISQGVIKPMESLAGLASSQLPVPDAVSVIEHPTKALEELAVFVAGEARAAVLEAWERRVKKEDEVASCQLPVASDEDTGDGKGNEGAGAPEETGTAGEDEGEGEGPEEGAEDQGEGAGAPEETGTAGVDEGNPKKKKNRRGR